MTKTTAKHAARTANQSKPGETARARSRRRSSPTSGTPMREAGARTKAKRETKRDLCLKLMARRGGASVAELQQATGWQAHSVRAALTGLRKQGIALSRSKNEAGTTRYRVAGGAANAA